jgi:hypothetical protein
MPLYTYSFQEKKRDLSDVLSTIVKEEPRFISNFTNVENARQQKHEWLEDQISGRSVTASGVTSLVVTASEADVAKLKAGSLLTVKDDTTLFRVSQVNTATTFTVALVAANGSARTTPAASDVLNIVSTPIAEGSNNGDGEESYRGNGTAYTACQIFRKDIVISGSALAVQLYGNIENQINRQTAFALGELARDLNRVALFGRRVEASGEVKGETGGLYCFGTQGGGLSVNASGNIFDSFIVNDAAQAVLGEGGNPTQILCSPGQARVLSNEYKKSLQIVRADEARGAYVAVIVNEINGRTMTIMADPDIPDTEAWVNDVAGFGMSNLGGRALSDEDATPKGFDGIKRMALGELTLVFKNARQRLCRVYGLRASATALAAIKAGSVS